jgi:hypothetical protein
MRPSLNLLKISAFTFLLVGISHLSQAADVVIPGQPATTPAAAASSDSAAAGDQVALFNRNLAFLGVTYDLVGANLSINIDEQKVLDAIPKLEAKGIIGKMDLTILSKQPLTVTANMIGVSLSVVILEQLLTRNNSLNSLHVETFIQPKDGSPKQSCFTFTTTSSAIKNLKLATLTPQIFMSSTPDFAYTTWCKAMMKAEQTPAS